MTNTTYWLSILFSINNTANFLAIISGFSIGVLFMLRNVGEFRELQVPKALWFTFWAALVFATITPGQEQAVTALAVDQGPVVAKELIQVLRGANDNN